MEGTIEIKDVISSVVKSNISLNLGSNDKLVLILNPLVRLSNVIGETPVMNAFDTTFSVTYFISS